MDDMEGTSDLEIDAESRATPLPASSSSKAAAVAVRSGGGRSSDDGFRVQTARGLGSSSAKKAAKEKKLCVVCNISPRTGNNPYCKEDKREHEAIRKDAEAQGKLERFDKANSR